VTSDRLTRNELTWLLAQEARSAAQKLRQGVGMPTGLEVMPPPLIIEEGSGGVESTLNRLDDAVNMLASLHGHTATRGRRGKIDLAALVWEVAPEARVQLEMGEGTTVFGDESELRRMLHVLIGMSGDPSTGGGTPGVTIRRNGDEVRVGINLGPDTSTSFETERVWLSRMAVRYGGRLELDGATRTLILGADVDTHRRELESLKRELAAAQAQGEAYARELATLFNREISSIPGPPLMPGSVGSISGMPPLSSRFPSSGGDGLPVLVAAMRSLGADLRGILAAIGRDIAPLRDREGEAGEIAASVGRHVTGASEVVADLTRFGACPIGEIPRSSDLADLLRDVVQSDLVRAARHDVRVVVNAPDHLDDNVPAASLNVLFHALLDHAISASPPGSEAIVTLTDEATGAQITFDDAGPALSPSARSGLLSRDFEAIALGRPRALSLIAAYSIAANLRLSLEIEDSPRGGTRVRLALPRTNF
jgi:two-component system, OmpR family, sensor kinase